MAKEQRTLRPSYFFSSFCFPEISSRETKQRSKGLLSALAFSFELCILSRKDSKGAKHVRPWLFRGAFGFHNKPLPYRVTQTKKQRLVNFASFAP